MSADDEGFTDMNPPPETGIFNAVDRHSSSVIQIDNGKAVHAVAICAAFCGLCTAISVYCYVQLHDELRDSSTEKRLTQQHVMQLEARLKELE
jgi:peroxiredoxin